MFRPVEAVGLTWGVTVSSAVITTPRHRQQHQRKREEEEKIAAARGGERDEQVVSRRGAATESRCGGREREQIWAALRDGGVGWVVGGE